MIISNKSNIFFRSIFLFIFVILFLFSGKNNADAAVSYEKTVLNSSTSGYLVLQKDAYVPIPAVLHIPAGDLMSVSPDILQISNQSYLYAKAIGYTTLFYRAGGSTHKISVCVSEIQPSKEELILGEKARLSAFGLARASLTDWDSSNPGCVYVDSNGLLHARHSGSAVVSCKTASGNILSTTFQVMSAEEAQQRKAAKETPEIPDTFTLSCEDTNLLMQGGDRYSLSIEVKKDNILAKDPKLIFHSEDNSIASVDQRGTITAKSDGCTTITCHSGDQSISVYLTVLSDGQSGKSCQYTTYTSTGKKRTYTLFQQNAHNYSSYDSYMAWHGCAHCSLTTVLGAYNHNYANSRPNDIISGLEKRIAPASAWKREHVQHGLKSQMPLSLFGITTLLRDSNISVEYIKSFSYKEARADILNHLKTGNPVIFEVRQKNHRTGKKTTRWTNSYHTMVFLGVFTNGKILLCDSVNRSWYDGGQRNKIISIDDVMDYMYSCTRDTTSMYFDGSASDGGYIKVFE